ncbi:MAG: helix-turn-helix transcriptional regulator [Lachnospiraceae bacterium]|nr:helix-turn-helix transcriptional regulator [Lachnospiraceae bacterium]
MKINEQIRNYRKKQNLTQEQLANYLGVTAPAVNKWENGNSYPDITLLAPLARVLKTDVDTLLSFREELTDLEIGNFVNEITEEMFTKGFEAAFERVGDKIKEHPGCDKLTLSLSQVMNGYLSMNMEKLSEKEKYQKQIMAWLEAAAFSEDVQVANAAAVSLAQQYMINQEYDKAQKFIDKIPPVGFDRRITQATLYKYMDKTEEAYAVYEELMYQKANDLMINLIGIISLLQKENRQEEIQDYLKRMRTLAECFDLGNYTAASLEFEIAAKEKEEEKSIEALTQMVDGLEHMTKIRESGLYRHMKWKEDPGMDRLMSMLKKNFDQEEEMDFLRQNPKFRQLMKRLKSDEID